MQLNSYGKNVHFIDIGSVIKVNRKDIVKDGNEYRFFCTPIEKWVRGKKRTFYRNLKFPRDNNNIPDGAKVKILSMFEDIDIYNGKIDWNYRINEYEIVEEPDLASQEAILDYQQQLEENKKEIDFSNLIQ